jgi:hypothetical protein
MESYVLKQETRGEEESKDSNDDDDDGDDEEEEDEEMGDLDDDDNLLIEIEDSKSSLLPSGAEDSEIDQLACPLTNSTKTPLSEPDVVQKIELSEPSKNGFLTELELDVKPKVELVTSSPESNPSSETIQVTTVTNRESIVSGRNPLLRALKRKGPVTIVKLSPKRRAPIKPYDDDDVIVLSD